MKRHKIILSLLVVLAQTVAFCDCAFAFNVEIMPSEVMPGDAFAVKVTGLSDSNLPDAYLTGKRLYFNKCGEDCLMALGVIGMEKEPGIYTVEIKDGGITKKTGLTLKHPVFRTIKLTLPKAKVFLSPEDLARAKKEEERLALLWKTETEKLWDGNFVLPLDNEILTAFGTKRIINKKMVSIHRGVDIKGKEGTEIRASNKGRVVLAEELFFGGNTLILDHGQGIYTIYMHLSGFNAKYGDIVSKKDIIGFVGSSGRASGPHLHFGLKVLNTNTNPFSLVRLIL